MDRRALIGALLAGAACGADRDARPRTPPPEVSVSPAAIRLVAGTATTVRLAGPPARLDSRLHAPGVTRLDGSVGRADVPGEARFVFQPVAGRYVRGTWTLTEVGAAPGAPIVVPIVATAYATARVRVDGPATVDLGPVAIDGSARAELRIRNEGARGASVRLQAPAPLSLVGGGATLHLAALTSTTVWLRVHPARPGPFTAPAYARTGTATVEVVFRGHGVAPRLRAEPPHLSFGAQVEGSVTPLGVQLSNDGGGLLPVERVELSPGAAAAFELVAPDPPWLLDGRGLRARVRFSPRGPGPHAGELRVHHTRGVDRVPLAGVGVACEDACRVPNGRPRCDGGRCAVDGCEAGFFDANGAVDDGCECEDGADPGADCAAARDLGRIAEGSAARTVAGRLFAPDDVDLVRFHAEDGFHVFREDFDVRVELASDDDVRLCVSVRRTDAPRPECLMTAPVCPADGRFRLRGRYGVGDAADFIVRIERGASAPPCPRYTLRVRNG